MHFFLTVTNAQAKIYDAYSPFEYCTEVIVPEDYRQLIISHN